jgi:molecular chaperone GrpE (heat shock protein)
MAKKKASKTGKKRIRRSPEQIIEDLEKQIEEVKARAQARALKRSPAVKTALGAVRQIDRALELAADEEDSALRHALADARAPLKALFEEKGVKLPKARLPRGPRPK